MFAQSPRPPVRWRRLQLPLVIAGAYLAVGLLTRLVLFLAFAGPEQLAVDGLPGILARGLWNDAGVLVFLLLPVSLAIWLLSRTRARPARRWLAFGLLAMILFGMLFLMEAELLYFEEFDARFNLVAVDYLRYPTEVLVNIHESYPLAPILLGTALAASALAAWAWRRLGHRRLSLPPRRQSRRLLGGNLLLAGVLATGPGIQGATGDDDRLTRELSDNGVARFVQALRTNELDFHQYYRGLAPARAHALLAAELQAGGSSVGEEPDGTLTQRVAADPAGLGPLNVVVVVEESLGANHVSNLGGPAGLTPELDALAAQGVAFTQAYATGTRTVRGLEAINLSVPPAPGESLLKRPGSPGLTSWGEIMQGHGYNTSFVYGGHAYFDGMREFFAGNGMRVVDRGDLPEPHFANIWGVSDEDLFAGALVHLDAESSRGAPFFAVILTTSNHKPFTFPAGVPGVPAQGGGRLAGVRYADHALGGFLRAAADHTWYADTLFVVLGDHGARVYGAAELPVASYRIPVLLFAPGRLPAARVATPMSQMDVAPTVLGLLGLAWEAPFFGRDVLHHGSPDRPLYMQHNYTVGMLTGGRLALLGFQRHTEVQGYDLASQVYTTVPDDPALVERATAVYQSAYDLYRSHRSEGG